MMELEPDPVQLDAPPPRYIWWVFRISYTHCQSEGTEVKQTQVKFQRSQSQVTNTKAAGPMHFQSQFRIVFKLRLKHTRICWLWVSQWNLLIWKQVCKYCTFLPSFYFCMGGGKAGTQISGASSSFPCDVLTGHLPWEILLSPLLACPDRRCGVSLFESAFMVEVSMLSADPPNLFLFICCCCVSFSLIILHILDC